MKLGLSSLMMLVGNVLHGMESARSVRVFLLGLVIDLLCFGANHGCALDSTLRCCEAVFFSFFSFFSLSVCMVWVRREKAKDFLFLSFNVGRWPRMTDEVDTYLVDKLHS